MFYRYCIINHNFRRHDSKFVNTTYAGVLKILTELECASNGRKVLESSKHFVKFKKAILQKVQMYKAS